MEELLRRLRGVLPEAPLVGGVTQLAAWGAGASLRGALFLNSDTHDQGAVGCLLRGPLRFDQLVLQVRPARCKAPCACAHAHHPQGPLLHCLHERRAAATCLTGSAVLMHRPVVAQGCRPVGEVVRVTGAQAGAQGSLITQLDGRPALNVVRRLPAPAPGHMCRLGAPSTAARLALPGH